MTAQEIPERRVHAVAKDFHFTRLAHPTTGASQIADRGHRAVRRLLEWGVRVPPTSRLVRAAKFIDSAQVDEVSIATATDEYLTRIGESTRTIVELYFATHTSVRKPAKDVLEKFAAAIKGTDTPDEERSHTARDTQFELYVWGLMNASGIPCRFVEPPDLTFEHGLETVGIAAKRIWSLGQARKRMSLGAAQIKRSGLRGFIAVNAQEYLSAAAAVDDLAVKGDEFNKDVARIHGHTPYLAKKPNVLGLLVCGTVYKWGQMPGGGPRIAFSSYHQLLVMTDNADEEMLARQLADKQMNGLRTWVRDNM